MAKTAWRLDMVQRRLTAVQARCNKEMLYILSKADCNAGKTCHQKMTAVQAILL